MSKSISHNIILVSLAAIITAHEILASHEIEIKYFWGTPFILILAGSLGFLNILHVSESANEIEDEIFYQMQVFFLQRHR